MAKREELRERRRQAARRRQVTFLAVVGGLALVVAAVIVFQNTRPVGQIVRITPQPHAMARGRELGDAKAPVLLEEYSDFQ
jgi:hypothetical protein